MPRFDYVETIKFPDGLTNYIFNIRLPMNIKYKNDWSSNNQVSLWSEKYRPKRVEDCVISDFKKQELLHMLKSNDLPNLLLYGSSGIGKTTVARAMCEQLQCDYLFLTYFQISKQRFRVYIK